MEEWIKAYTVGWNIAVYRKVSDRTIPAVMSDGRGELVVHWSANVGGRDWIEEACTGSDAIALGGSGYPYVYTAKPHAIAKVLAGEIPPDCRQRRSTTSHDGDEFVPMFKLDAEVAAKLSDDEWLILIVFDTS